MTVPAHDVVFLLDVDNTLLDNDGLVADLRERLVQALGAPSAERYWVLFEQLRDELGYVDYLGALQRLRQELAGRAADEQALLGMSGFLLDYPFRDRVYPGALDVLALLARLGPTVILSDGDVVFQPRKVERSGLWDAVQGRVLVYVHKERVLDEVRRAYPARRYVLVDDKRRILAEVKDAWGDDVTTVCPRQGHYADDPSELARRPPPDVLVERIGDIARMNIAAWLRPPGARHEPHHPPAA